MKAFIFLVLLTSNAWAGPILVGNGAGESEYSLIFTRENLSQILADCFAVTCDLNPEETKRLSVLNRKSKSVPKAVFKTSEELGDSLYVMKNQSNEIWFNQDKLWLDEDKSVPLGMGEAANLWVDVLLEGESVSQDDREQLADGLAVSLKNQMGRYAAALDNGQTFELLDWQTPGKTSRLFVRDPMVQNIELTERVRSHLNCGKAPAEKLSFYAPAWITMTGNGKGTLVFNIAFGLKWKCGEKSYSQSGNTLITARLNSYKIFEIDPSLTRIVIDAY